MRCPLGWTVMNLRRTHVLRLGWRLLVRFHGAKANIWVPLSLADFDDVGTSHSVVAYEVEENAKQAAADAGGIAVALQAVAA